MTLKDSIIAIKDQYNATIDSTIAQINATRTATNASLDAAIDQVTKVAIDFPASLVAPVPAPAAPQS